MGVARWLTGGLVCLLGPVVGACTIPVFRYALERWEASPYEVIVFTRGAVAEGDKEVLRGWARRPGNVEFRVVDLAKEVSEADETLWKREVKEAGAVAPWVVVRFPESGERAPAVWSGRLEAGGIGAVADSPGRREIARRLMAGESAVWVVVEDSDRAKNDALVRRLEGELKRLEGTLVLPEIAAEGPQLRAGLPLLVKFSVLRVSRADPKEAALVRMLSVAEPEFIDSKETLVAPVIGRGRAVSAILGSKVDEGKVGAFAEFICGQCSCEVKEMNPGVDLLMMAEWDSIFGEGKGETEPVVKAGERVAIPPGVVAPAVGEVSVTPAAGAKPEVHPEMPKRFLVVVGILLLLTVVIAIVVDRLQRWSMRT